MSVIKFDYRKSFKNIEMFLFAEADQLLQDSNHGGIKALGCQDGAGFESGEAFTGKRTKRNGCEHYDIALRHYLNEINNFHKIFWDHKIITLQKIYIYLSNLSSCYIRLIYFQVR